MDIQMMQLKCFLIATPFMIAAYVSLYSSHLFSPETVVENMPARIAFSMVDQVVVVGPTYGRLHMLDTTSKANDEYVHVCALLNVKTKAEVLDVECGAIKLTAFILDVMHTMAFFIILHTLGWILFFYWGEFFTAFRFGQAVAASNLPDSSYKLEIL